MQLIHVLDDMFGRPQNECHNYRPPHPPQYKVEGVESHVSVRLKVR